MYKERCPYAKNTSGYCAEADDYIEGADLCTLVDKWCLLESGDTCETYEEFLNELLAEEEAEIQQQLVTDSRGFQSDFFKELALDEQHLRKLEERQEQSEPHS